MKYDHAMSIVLLRDYPANSLDWQHYYEFQNGVVRTAYIDVSDGFAKALSTILSRMRKSMAAQKY